MAWLWVVSMRYEIVVTEVTLYGPSLRCVAGFDPAHGVMIRPEPAPAGFWEAKVCGVNTTFHPGHVVSFAGDRPETALPHNAEDVVVRGEPRRARVLGDAAFRDILRRAEARSPAAVFGEHLRFDGDKAYVPAGAACGSLSGQTIDAARLRLSEQVYRDDHGLRAELSVAGHALNLSVAAKNFKQAFRGEGLAAAQALVPKQGRVHVRLGLARPFDEQADRCYLQVNGLYAL